MIGAGSDCDRVHPRHLQPVATAPGTDHVATAPGTELNLNNQCRHGVPRLKRYLSFALSTNPNLKEWSTILYTGGNAPC